MCRWSFPPSAGRPCSLGVGRHALHGLQHSGRHGLHRLLRERYARRNLHGAAVLRGAMGKKTRHSSASSPCRHPEDKNVELLWHCGPFAYCAQESLATVCARGEPCASGSRSRTASSPSAASIRTTATISLLAGTCESTEGPYTFGTYLWAKFKNLSAWERKLIEGPYIHHMAEIEGDYTEELREFTKYVKNVTLDIVQE